MITQKEYKELPERYWKGKMVRTRYKLENGYCVFPPGTVFEIYAKRSGFSLQKIETCDKCGIGSKAFISRVEPQALELMTYTDEAQCNVAKDRMKISEMVPSSQIIGLKAGPVRIDRFPPTPKEKGKD